MRGNETRPTRDQNGFGHSCLGFRVGISRQTRLPTKGSNVLAEGFARYPICAGVAGKICRNGPVPRKLRQLPPELPPRGWVRRGFGAEIDIPAPTHPGQTDAPPSKAYKRIGSRGAVRVVITRDGAARRGFRHAAVLPRFRGRSACKKSFSRHSPAGPGKARPDRLRRIS